MKEVFNLEVDAVKNLGERIGYGNMMAIASALWREALRHNGCPLSGACIPVLESDIKSGYKDLYQRETKRMEALLTPPPPTQNT